MAITPPEVIETPSPGRLRYGLFTASPPMDLPQRAFGGGVTYDTDHCATGHLAVSQCIASIGSNDVKTFDTPDGQVEGFVFAVYAGVLCGPAGYTFAEFEAKARRALAAGEQGAVELGLWTGLDAVAGDALGIGGFNNSSPDVVSVSDGLSIVSVVGALERFAYLTSGYGYEAYIHAPVEVAAYAADHGLIEMDGNLKRTPYGSIWVFGGGYPGTDSGGSVPADGVALYVTGKTNVWRSADVNVPDPAQTLDRTTNQQYVLAEREYAVSFDCLLGQATYTPFGGS